MKFGNVTVMSVLSGEKRTLNTIRAFGDCTLEMRTGQLRCKGVAVPLSELDARLLVALVSADGGTVDKAVLEEQVWQGRHVGDEALKQRIALLRRTLLDTGLSEPAIAAVRGEGYRFALPVKPAIGGPAVHRVLGAFTPKRLLIAAGVFLFWVLVVGLYENVYTSHRMRNTIVRLEPTTHEDVISGEHIHVFERAFAQAMVSNAGVAVRDGAGNADFSIRTKVLQADTGYEILLSLVHLEEQRIVGMRRYQLPDMAEPTLQATVHDMAEHVATIIRGFPKPE